MSGSFVVARDVKAPLARVWRVWTDGERFARWLAPTPETAVKVVSFDPRPGGAWRVEMREPGGAEWKGGGRFVEVEPMRRLVLTWAWAHQSGESLVTVGFTALGPDATQVVVTHERMAVPRERDDTQKGWQQALDGLAAAALT